MKSRYIGLASIAITFGLASIAFGELAGYNVVLQYTTSYDAHGHNLGQLPYTTIPNGDGTKSIDIAPGATGVVHQFEVYVTVHDLASDQDPHVFIFGENTTGGVTTGDGGIGIGNAYTPSALSTTMVDPPPMGPAGNQSDMPPSLPWEYNGFNSTGNNGGFGWIVATGTTTTGPGNGTYGDMAAAIHVGKTTPYDMGTLLLDANDNDLGSFNFDFRPNPGYFEVIGNNDGSSDLMGMGTPSTESYPSCVQCGDSVQFVVPEPSTLALLLTGTVGLLAYAWRQRQQWGA